MEKVCPRCAAKFTCSGENDCWCEDHQIHKKEMILIMEKFDDCLCPQCLSMFSEE
jgi:hypothetical protein